MADTSRRSPGRPRAQDGPAVTRAELLTAAAHLFSTRGYAGTSLRAIAEHVGVSLGTVQHHARTKAELFSAVVSEVMVPALEQPTGGTSAPGDVRAALEAHIRRVATGPNLAAMALVDRSPGADERRAEIVEATRPRRESVTASLDVGARLGVLREVDPLAIQVLLGFGVGVALASPEAVQALVGLDLGDEAERERLVAGIADVLAGGLLARSGGSASRPADAG